MKIPLVYPSIKQKTLVQSQVAFYPKRKFLEVQGLHKGNADPLVSLNDSI